MARPLKFQSVQELQEKIDAYFASIRGEDGNLTEPMTITGLALALDTTRQGLLNYEERDEFYDTIKRAKTHIENFAEKQLYLGKSATGSIFALKNFGWKDESTTKHDATESFAALVRGSLGSNGSDS
jgi:hypothetical protein